MLKNRTSRLMEIRDILKEEFKKIEELNNELIEQNDD